MSIPTHGTTEHDVEYDGVGVSVTGTIYREDHGDHVVCRVEYGIWTDAGADGPYEIEGLESVERAREALEAIARERGAII